MISQSRKKHRITARRSTRAIRISLAVLVSLGTGIDLRRPAGADDFQAVARTPNSFQPVSGNLKPVPKFAGSGVRDPQRAVAAATNTSSQSLQWRSSPVVAPPAQVAPPSQVAPPTQAARQAAPPTAVQQAQFQLPSGAAAPQSIPDTLQTPPATDTPLPDFFNDPFGEFPDPPVATPPIPLPELPPPVIPSPDATNDLRQPTVPRPVPIVPEIVDEPMELQPAPQPDTPPRRQIEDFQMPRRDEDRRPLSQLGAGSEDTMLVRPVAYSCDDFRRSIADATIQKVSLDISPPFRPDVIEYDEYQKMKQRFEEQQELRDWQSIDGRKLGRGRLRDLAYEKVIIETEFGTTEELPVTRISEADIAYVSAQWGLPKECLIAQPQYQVRHWEPSKITWKASNLMHKPLYFEEVNLERYGHTAGPILQPVVSSAHFFANIAVLPYKMGVHLPNECQYALGYYRPGDCAPWITQPVPLSLRGALFQAGAVTGAVLLIP